MLPNDCKNNKIQPKSYVNDFSKHEIRYYLNTSNISIRKGDIKEGTMGNKAIMHRRALINGTISVSTLKFQVVWKINNLIVK